jgi:hypothetical protein
VLNLVSVSERRQTEYRGYSGISVCGMILFYWLYLVAPRMREQGIVSEEQGRLALVALATIFLTIGVLVYAVVAAFEALSDNGKGKRNRRS